MTNERPGGEQAIRFGHPRLHLREAVSTNDTARELAEAGCPPGTVVTADAQSAGRGRQGRKWFAPPGTALLLSAVVRPLVAAGELLPLAVPVAVAEAVEELGAGPCEIKWPNDVWIEGRKVAGILIEARAEPDREGRPGGWAVVGVGLNVSVPPGDLPPELRETATSIGGEATVADALEAVCARLGAWAGAGAERVLAAFAPRDALTGREIAWSGAGGERGSGRGVAAGVDGRGELIVELAGGGRVTLAAGEVHLGAL